MRWGSNKPSIAWDRERHPRVGLWKTWLAKMPRVLCFVVATSLCSSSCLTSTVLDNQTGNLCGIITSSQPTMVYWVAFLTSIHAMLGARFRRWRSKVTVVSISKLTKVPLHPSRAPLWAPSIESCVCRCLFPGPNMNNVNHLYMVFKQVISLWLSLVNCSGFGSSVVLPSENQAEYSKRGRDGSKCY